ncbi:MAG: PilZ domain-containing protein [Candidatus Omnitrophica bacterium]|nr:PilZ domain-containing protein [Candidatus Omnitrophota bacterium]
MNRNRKFIRLDTCLKCEYDYLRAGEEIKGEGVVLDISGGGVKMVSKERIAVNRETNLTLEFPDGALKIKGEVLKSKIEWYISDEEKKTFWATSLTFKDISLQERKKIIQYVHDCAQEKREARYKNPRKK